MITIGNRRIICTQTFLIPEGEAVKFNLEDPPNQPLPMAIYATAAKSQNPYPIYWGTEANGVFTLHFEQVGPMVTVVPGYIFLGKLTQGKLSFNAAYAQHNTLTTLIIAFAVEKES